MPEPFDRQISSEVTRYLRGDISPRDFNRWFMPVSWSALRTGDPALEELVGFVGLLLAEASSGHTSEANVRKELASVASAEARDGRLDPGDETSRRHSPSHRQ